MSDTFIQMGQPTGAVVRHGWMFVRTLFKCWNCHRRVCSGVMTCAVIAAMIAVTTVQPDNKSNYKDRRHGTGPLHHLKLIARTAGCYCWVWSVIGHQATSPPGEGYHLYRAERSTCGDKDLRNMVVESWLRLLHAKYLLRYQS